MIKSERPICGKSFCLRHRAPAYQPTCAKSLPAINNYDDIQQVEEGVAGSSRLI